MATAAAFRNFKSFDSRRCNTIEWNLVNNETGDWIESAGLRDRSVQIDGSFGGNSCAIEGSNDGVNFYLLRNPLGDSLELISNGFHGILEPSRYIRPRVIGTGNSSIKITMFLGA